MLQASTIALRDYGRVVAVVLFWEEWRVPKAEAPFRLAMFREMTNQRSRFYRNDISGFIKRWDDQPDPAHWVRLEDVLASFLISDPFASLCPWIRGDCITVETLFSM